MCVSAASLPQCISHIALMGCFYFPGDRQAHRVTKYHAGHQVAQGIPTPWQLPAAFNPHCTNTEANKNSATQPFWWQATVCLALP